jgi:DNA polymerase V
MDGSLYWHPLRSVCSTVGTQQAVNKPAIVSQEAVATYTARAAKKLRAQGSMCKKMRVSVRTGMFNPDEARYANGVLVELPYPTHDTLLLTNAATQAV